MNNDSQFEDRLRRQSPKEVPGEWRKDILREAARAAEVQRVPRTRPLWEWLDLLRGGLLSTPRAWVGLATVWAAILVLNQSGGPDSTSTMAAPISAAQAQMALKQKQFLMAELAGRTETREAVQPRAIAPGPRSQRREETSAV
jgi:hypothetical protein